MLFSGENMVHKTRVRVHSDKRNDEVSKKIYLVNIILISIYTHTHINICVYVFIIALWVFIHVAISTSANIQFQRWSNIPVNGRITAPCKWTFELLPFFPIIKERVLLIHLRGFAHNTNVVFRKMPVCLFVISFLLVILKIWLQWEWGKKSQLGTKLPLPSIITLSQMVVSKESVPVLGVDRLPLQSPGGSKTNLNLWPKQYEYGLRFGSWFWELVSNGWWVLRARVNNQNHES